MTLCKLAEAQSPGTRTMGKHHPETPYYLVRGGGPCRFRQQSLIMIRVPDPIFSASSSTMMHFWPRFRQVQPCLGRIILYGGAIMLQIQISGVGSMPHVLSTCWQILLIIYTTMGCK